MRLILVICYTYINQVIKPSQLYLVKYYFSYVCNSFNVLVVGKIGFNENVFVIGIT